MKRIFITLAIALAAMLPINSNAAQTVVHQKGDSTVIVDGKDTAVVVGAQSILKMIDSRLNDTLLESPMAGGVDNASNAGDPHMIYQYQDDQVNPTLIVGIIFLTIFGIVAVCMVIYYLQRKAKYKMIEKAIENDYPLPGYLFDGTHTTQIPQSRQMPYSDGQSQKANDTQQFYSDLKWNNAMREGIKLTAVGVGLVLFFSIMGIGFMAGICTIPLMLGLGRICLAYLDKKNCMVQPPVVNVYQPKAPANPPSQSQATPPPFNGAQDNKEDNTPQSAE